VSSGYEGVLIGLRGDDSGQAASLTASTDSEGTAYFDVFVLSLPVDPNDGTVVETSILVDIGVDNMVIKIGPEESS